MASTVLAAPVVELRDSKLRMELSPYVDVFEDLGNKLAFEEVKSEKYAQRFSPSPLTELYFGYTDSAYWLRFSVENQQDNPQSLVFEVTPADIDRIDFYAVDQHRGETLFHKHSGSSVDFSQRDYDHPLYYLDTTLPPHTTHTYYVRLESNKIINAQLRLSTPKEHFYSSGSRDWYEPTTGSRSSPSRCSGWWCSAWSGTTSGRWP